jgi:CheY-like chemotaxis protein
MIPISPIKIFRKSRTLNKNKFISRNSLNKELSIFNNCSKGLSLKEEIEEDEMKSALEEDRNIVVNERSIDTVYRKFTLKRYKSINESSSLETPIHISTFKNLDIECFSYNILSNLNFMNDNSRIIVIEDQNLIRNSTIKLIETVLRDLNRPNFDVIGGCDGIDLLYYVIKDNLNSKIKCIFTDENMVYLNGSEAVRIIRKLEEMGKINKCFIVSITAFVDDYTKNNILSAGCNKIVSKPCNKSTIMEIIKNGLLYRVNGLLVKITTILMVKNMVLV